MRIVVISDMARNFFSACLATNLPVFYLFPNIPLVQEARK